ncbi:MAG: protein kinase [Deltaproteobacteria bacterium]|nr:protein kinase [Deltaproteobacteria bacterium]
MNCTTCKRELPDPPGRVCVHCGTPIAKGGKAARDPLIGAEVAQRFRVEELIGQGGMGKVYRARHLSLDKLVCLKMLKPSLLDDPTLVGRFEREAKAASRINHQNCIQVLDFGRSGEEGTLFIAMEYVQGKDLRLVLRDEWPIDEGRLCNIMAQVCSALAEAHSQNVLHRDLKPENIMVEQRRDRADFVKVLDFGIAKIMDSDVPGLTRADVVCGTPQYMAPEQATGSALDARCDLYAVGVILYQLTTGSLPFDGQNSMEVLTKHVNEPPLPPRTKMPQAPISEAMEKLILRALEKDPAARPQTALEFQKLLEEVGALYKATGGKSATPANAQAAASGVIAPGGPKPTGAKATGAAAGAKGTGATASKATGAQPPKATGATGTAGKSAPEKAASEAALAQAGDGAPAAATGSKRPLYIGLGVAAALVVSLGAMFAARQSTPPPTILQAADAPKTGPGATATGSNPGPATGATNTNSVAAASKRDPKRAADLVEQAHQKTRDGNTAAARDLFEEAIEFDDANAEAHFGLGGLFRETKPARAREEYEKARKLDSAKYGDQVQIILSTLP